MNDNQATLDLEIYNDQISNNGSLYILLYEFERIMRNFMIYCAEQSLKLHYNNNWETEFYKRIKVDLLKTIERNCEHEKSIAVYTGMKIDYRKEDFLPFSFISEAAEAWWDQVYSQHLIHKQYFMTDIDKVKNVRNAISHFRRTTTEAQLETFSICRRLLSIAYSVFPNKFPTDILAFNSLVTNNRNSSDSIYCDVEKIYLARSEVREDLQSLLKKAQVIEAMGISINELTQNFGDKDYVAALERGARFTLLFLDPDGINVNIREQEEGVHKGLISDATKTNLFRLSRLKSELELDGIVELYKQINIILYDDIPRCNLVFIDNKVVYVQYYANYVKGENNPTFCVVNNDSRGIYSFYRKIFDRTLKRYSKDGNNMKV